MRKNTAVLLVLGGAAVFAFWAYRNYEAKKAAAGSGVIATTEKIGGAVVSGAGSVGKKIFGGASYVEGATVGLVKTGVGGAFGIAGDVVHGAGSVISKAMPWNW